MNSEKPRDEEAIAKKILTRLQAVRFDPAFSKMLTHLEKIQAKLDTLVDPQWPEIQKAMQSLDRMWDVSGWNGTGVTIGGKLRLSGDFAGVVDAVGLEGLEKGIDERGDFFVARGADLVCFGFSVDEKTDMELDEYRPLVLMLAPPDEFDEIDGPDDCMFMIYPDEIDSLEFRESSLVGNEANLKYYFPGIYDYVSKSLPDGSHSDRDVTKALKNLAVQCDNPDFHGFDLLKSLKGYIMGRIDFDTTAYEIRYDGPIRGLSEDHEDIEIYPEHQFDTISVGYICGILMELSGDTTYRPSLVVAVPGPDAYDNFEAYVVPAESLMRLRNLRSRVARMGKIAAFKFEYLDEVADYFSGAHAKMYDQITPVVERFSDITETVQHDLPDIVAYDDVRRLYRVSIQADLECILKNYDKLVKKVGNRTVTEDDCNDICAKMLPTIEQLASLSPGDILTTHGVTLAIDTDGPDQESVMIEPGEYIQGRFCGFAISEVPDAAMRITAGEVGFTERDISILIKDVVYISQDGTTHTDVFQSPEVALPIARIGDPTIFKVLQEADGE